MNDQNGSATKRVSVAITSLGGLALLAWAARPQADGVDRSARPAATSSATSGANEPPTASAARIEQGMEARSDEVSREETNTPTLAVTAEATRPWPPTDDDYRAGRLRALKAALSSLQDPAISLHQRITNAELLATASVATLLDAQGAYEGLPRGQRTRDVHLQDHERVNFNGRIYQVDLATYPEFHEARRLMWSLRETTAAPQPLTAPAVQELSGELLQHIAARAEEAIQVVEGDLAAR